MSWDPLCSEWDGAACTAPWDVPFRIENEFVPGGLSRLFVPEWDGATCTAPWDYPFRIGDEFVPGGLSRLFPFWSDVSLVDRPDRVTILPWVRDDVSVYEFLLPYMRRVSVEQPFNPAAFLGRYPTEYRRSSVSLSRRNFPPSFAKVVLFRSGRCVRSTTRLGRESSYHAPKCRAVKDAHHLRCASAECQMSAHRLLL